MSEWIDVEIELPSLGGNYLVKTSDEEGGEIVTDYFEPHTQEFRGYFVTHWKPLQKSETEWNDGYWTEGLDRIHNAATILEVTLIGHPSFEKAGLEDDVIEAIDKLYNLYNKMSEKIN